MSRLKREEREKNILPHIYLLCSGNEETKNNIMRETEKAILYLCSRSPSLLFSSLATTTGKKKRKRKDSTDEQVVLLAFFGKNKGENYLCVLC